MTSDRDERDEPVVITDKRKIDPVTGKARQPSAAGAAGAGVPAAPPAPEPGRVPMVEAALLEERTSDLQRVQAEYANYRRRADRDRLAAGEMAIGRVLADFLPVLDNLDRARDHGDLTGGLKAVADQLETVFDKLGLTAFGAVGDRFDPAVHEAVMHDESEAVDEPTCTAVLRPGYRYKDRLLRAAMVGVSDPAPTAPPERAFATVPESASAIPQPEPGWDGAPQPPGQSATGPAPDHSVRSTDPAAQQASTESGDETEPTDKTESNGK